MELALNHAREFGSFDKLLTLNMSLLHPFEELVSLNLSENYFEGLYENKGMYINSLVIAISI